MQRGIGVLVHTVIKAAWPSLRVVALVYTGMSGIAALVVIVTAAVAPKAPVVQQVSEPARQAVTTLVQPATDMIGSLMPAPVVVAPAPVAAPTEPTAAPFVDTTSLDVTVEDEIPAPVGPRAPVFGAPVRPGAPPAAQRGESRAVEAQ